MNTDNVKRDNIMASLGRLQADLIIKNGNVLNVFTEKFEKNNIAIKNGYIIGIEPSDTDCLYSGKTEIDAEGKYIVPGFIDGHIHIESSLISPQQFVKTVALHGTTAVITDPHEITNVCGKVGFQYMIEATKNLPVDCYFMVPSCVPSTPFDENKANIYADDVEQLMNKDNRVLGLAEMMNYPGVIDCDSEILQKITIAEKKGKQIDGHAPGISGKELNAYVTAGIHSEHECTSIGEAMEKLSRGMWIMIREGTAGKNLLSLIELFQKPYCDRCLLVTDDKHPGELAEEGHIDHIVRKAIRNGVDPILAYKMSSFNAASYFGLKHNGAISPGYYADFAILDDMEAVKISSVYKRGRRIDDCIDELIGAVNEANPYVLRVCDTVKLASVTESDFAVNGGRKVIGLVPGELVTTDEGVASEVDIDKDICKLAVIERHNNTGHMGVAFVKGYGLKHGAVATSIAHDSHNIIVAGTNDSDMAKAAMEIKAMQGGMVVVSDGKVLYSIQLAIAGLMGDDDAVAMERKVTEIKKIAYEMGVSRNIDPFMTLSFSSLAVIPALRLTTMGVVDVTSFKLIK